MDRLDDEHIVHERTVESTGIARDVQGVVPDPSSQLPIPVSRETLRRGAIAQANTIWNG